MKNVSVLIVTYNRKIYLLQLLKRLSDLDYPINRIFVFDNNSEDGTSDYLINEGIIDSANVNEQNIGKLNGVEIIYYKNGENSGGSGGFHDGMKLSMNYEYDCLWCMDDDVLPSVNCLSEMILCMDEDHRLVVPSRIDCNYYEEAIIRIDVTNPFKFSNINTLADVKSLSSSCIKVEGFAFEGPLIDRTLIEEIGFINKDLFIFFDDTDYAYRANKKTDILYCKNAIMHRQIVVSSNSHIEYGWREYYAIRNRIWFDKTNGENIYVRTIRPRIYAYSIIIKSLLRLRMKNAFVAKEALNDAMLGNMGKVVDPSVGIQYKK